MDLSPFKLDIDELIDEFVECESTTLADMKRIWRSRRFSFIYEARPSTNLSFFMQSLFAHAIGHMVNTTSLSRRLGGLYCLYCLYETQPFEPPFRVYLSLGELQKLENLVIEANKNGINVVTALVKVMWEKNMFLFGFVDTNEASVNAVNQLTELQNARVQVAYDKLFKNTQIENFLHMDLGSEVDLNSLREISTGYEEAKKQAISEASKEVDVQNIMHVAEDKELMVDAVDKMAENWNVQREAFYQQTGLNHQHLALAKLEEHQQEDNEQEDYDEFDELERLLFSK